MLQGRPLYANTADSRYMVWTEDARAAYEALARRRNTLVHGPPGSGKTTVLHQAERNLREEGRPVLEDGSPVLFAALRGVEDVADVPDLLFDAALETGLLGADELRAAGPRESEGPFSTNRAVRRLGALPGATIVLLDDVGSALGHALFGRLRDELWQLPLSWGVAASDAEVGGLLTPPADAFFETRISLRPLEASDRIELVKLRATYGVAGLSATQIEEIGRSGPGHPRQLVDYARMVAEDDIDPQLLLAAGQRRLEAAESAAGRDGAMIVAVMQQLGPVSASDDALAADLGWPRPRIASALNRLESVDVARSFRETREGRTGRPRKLYELTPETAWIKR